MDIEQLIKSHDFSGTTIQSKRRQTLNDRKYDPWFRPSFRLRCPFPVTPRIAPVSDGTGTRLFRSGKDCGFSVSMSCRRECTSNCLT